MFVCSCSLQVYSGMKTQHEIHEFSLETPGGRDGLADLLNDPQVAIEESSIHAATVGEGGGVSSQVITNTVHAIRRLPEEGENVYRPPLA